MSEILIQTNSIHHFPVSYSCEELDELLKSKFEMLRQNTPLVENNDPFTITVVTMTGRRLTLLVHPSTTIHNLKQLIYKQDEIMLDQQRIIFNGKQLEDGTIKNANITPDSTLHLILRLRGGMYHSTSGRQDFISLNFIMKRDKGMAMIRYMREKYDVIELMDILHSKLIECSTNDEINQVFVLIKKYYIE